MVHQRATALALTDRRTAPYVLQAHYEQAKRELTGESDLDLQEAILDATPEAGRSDPVPLSGAVHGREPRQRDEGAEGRPKTGLNVTRNGPAWGFDGARTAAAAS